MGHGHSHHDLLAELVHHFRLVLDNSEEGVYLWVDGENSVCNERLAKMLGLTPEEWSHGAYLDLFVDPKDQEMFAGNYERHVATLAGPVRFRFTARRKDGSTFAAETDMIPISFGGHAVAYHFVRQAK